MSQDITQDSRIKEARAPKGERLFDVTVKHEWVASLYGAQLARKAKTTTLKGFRKGKAPLDHIAREYGQQLHEEVIRFILDVHIQKLVKEHELRLIHAPQCELKKAKDDVAFSVRFFLFPEIKEPQWDKIILEKKLYQIEDKDVEDALLRICESRRNFTSSGKPAQKGDRVVIDYETSLRGKKLDKGAGKDAMVLLGGKMPLEGLEAKLTEAQKGASFTLTAPLPDAFGDELKGKKADFAITVKDVLSAPPLRMDEALAKQLGCASLVDLKKRLKDSLIKEGQQISQRKLIDEFMNNFSKSLDVHIAEHVIEAEAKRIMGERKKDEITPDAQALSDAGERLRLTLSISELAKRHEINVSENDITGAMRLEASRYGDEAEKIFARLSNDESMRQRMRYALLESQFCQFALKKVTIKEVAKPFSQLYDVG